jgi:hypothetical protein
MQDTKNAQNMEQLDRHRNAQDLFGCREHIHEG